MTIDDRSFVMQAVATMPISTSVVYMYPRLLPLHDVDPDSTDLPQMLRCSIDKFTEDGAYLLGMYNKQIFTKKLQINKKFLYLLLVKVICIL